MKRLLGIGLSVLLLSSLGAGVYWRISGHESTDEYGSGVGGDASFDSDEFSTTLPIAVAGVPVVRDTMVLTVTASGQAAALRRATVTAQVSGRVTSVPVRESGAVGRGAVLVQVDPVEYDMALREAEASLAQARRQYEELTLGDDRIADPRSGHRGPARPVRRRGWTVSRWAWSGRATTWATPVPWRRSRGA
jgi:membrane fusion protein, multidrug efflux system